LQTADDQLKALRAEVEKNIHDTANCTWMHQAARDHARAEDAERSARRLRYVLWQIAEDVLPAAQPAQPALSPTGTALAVRRTVGRLRARVAVLRKVARRPSPPSPR